MQQWDPITRRSFCGGLVGAATASAMPAWAQNSDAISAGSPVLTPPRIVGPIPVTSDSRPTTTTATAGSFTAGLLKQFDYVEEEYFLFGYANIYGPGTKAKPGNTLAQVEDLRPLGGLVRPRMPYATRLLMVRPRDNRNFSGRVLAYTFHNLTANMMVEPYFLRNGDVVLGVEGNTGARYGAVEQPRGGMATLHASNLDRYRDLFLSPADPLAWPDLLPGKVGEASVKFTLDDRGVVGGIFLQEMTRAYAQAPDIMTQVAHALKLNNPALPFEGKVTRLVNYAASGGSTFLARYIDYHHKAAMLPDGRPAFDGYMVAVGILPHTRPDNAVLTYVLSEGDTIVNLKLRGRDPADTDTPRFRAYQIPGTGHLLSAPLPGMPVDPADRQTPEGIHYYDKQNKPILWGMWQNMFDWIEHGRPMPQTAPLRIDETAPDQIARDQHGNALGGLRTPWVDVPDGTYLGRVSQTNPLRAGYRPFSEEKMKELYRSRDRYIEAVNKRVDRMVRDRWIMKQDADLMKLKA